MTTHTPLAIAGLVVTILGGLAGLVLLVLAPAAAQAPSACQDAETYHLRRAGLWSEREDQSFHVAAAQAYKSIGDAGGDCSGWEQDAGRPPAKPPEHTETTGRAAGNETAVPT